MKPRWNIAIWSGLALAVAGAVLYLPMSARWTVQADWIALALFLGGLVLICTGVGRAYARPGQYRGRIAGPIVLIVEILLTGYFSYGIFYVARHLPPAGGAPRVGQQAPDFTLLDQEGREVSLAGLLAGDDEGPAAAVLLIFYRGYW